MVKLDAVRQSPSSILVNSKASRKAYDKAWASASRAPVFCKIVKRATADGKAKKFYRTQRMIGSHAYMIAASGAAANAATLMEAECNALREEPEVESSRAPWLPQISKGAKMVMEQFLCALAQEATKKAHFVREGAGNTKRLSQKHMKIGWDLVFENVFSNSAMMPKSMFVAPVVTKKTKAKSKKAQAQQEEEEDYAPEEEAPAEEEA